jgi:chemosensory pili system protein ChpC
MQLPLLDMQLLLPNSVVAEIIGYNMPDDEQRQSGWLHGNIEWRGVSVPVISVEKLCELEVAPTGARTRIAVVYNPANDADLPYIGLILQDIPRAYLAEEERLSGEIVVPGCKYLLSQLDVMSEHQCIPDLDAIAAVIKQQAA